MLKNWFILLLLILQTLTVATGLAAPQLPPKPADGTGIYVQDYAGVLSDKAKSTILTLGSELDQKTTAQVAVVTIKSLEGNAIDDYATALYREWGLGTKEKNNGVLILVAVNDRKSRIEVGYGLEGVLPDGLTGRIQDQAMLPYFKQGKYSDGIVNGYYNTVQFIAKDAKVQLTGAKKVAAPKQQAQQQSRELEWSDILLILGAAGLLLIDNLFLGGFFTRLLLFSFFRGRGGGGGGGFGGGGFGGGSSGGGGSSRSW